MIFAAVSQAESFMTADRTPMGGAIRMLMKSANPASWRVAGRRCHTRPMADWPCHFQELPKSPRTPLRRKMRYWVCRGWSSPQYFDTRSYSSGPASRGSITSRGLPEIRARLKTSRLMTQIARRLWSARLAMNRCMVPPALPDLARRDRDAGLERWEWSRTLVPPGPAAPRIAELVSRIGRPWQAAGPGVTPSPACRRPPLSYSMATLR
jgi:hypothetical protein